MKFSGLKKEVSLEETKATLGHSCQYVLECKEWKMLPQNNHKQFLIKCIYQTLNEKQKIFLTDKKSGRHLEIVIWTE